MVIKPNQSGSVYRNTGAELTGLAVLPHRNIQALKVSTINIENRQKGRFSCKSIINCKAIEHEIYKQLELQKMNS